VANSFETDLTPAFSPLLLTGASGLPPFVVDTRIADANNLKPGVYQITRNLAYDSFTGDPVHRFYQMWQQYDCRSSNIGKWNPSGCYYDHVSITKFIEKNWKLKPLTSRTRDNFPNPIASRMNPYVPLNGPAIGDLLDMFDFDHPDWSR
jgi:hypothetical protein